MDENMIYDIVDKIQDLNVLFYLTMFMLALDVATGYAKAIYTRNIKSDLSRDGFFKKLSWLFAIVLAYGIYFIVGNAVVVHFVCVCCIITEFLSVNENLEVMGLKYININRKEDKDE